MKSYYIPTCISMILRGTLALLAHSGSTNASDSSSFGESHFTDVVVTINYPAHGSTSIATPFAPLINVQVAGTGPFADRLKQNPNEWQLCTRLNNDLPCCRDLVHSGESAIEMVGHFLSYRQYHRLRAIVQTSDGRDVAAEAASQFSILAPDMPTCDFMAQSPAIGPLPSPSSGAIYLDPLEGHDLLCARSSRQPLGGNRQPTLTGSLSFNSGVFLEASDASSSYQSLLAHFVRGTEGPVVELGASMGSTPLLRALVLSAGTTNNPQAEEEMKTGTGAIGRLLVTVDLDYSAELSAMRDFLPPEPGRHEYLGVETRDHQPSASDAWLRFFSDGSGGTLDSSKGATTGSSNFKGFSSGSRWSALRETLGSERPSVVFVNMPSLTGRQRALLAFAHRADYLVVHDVAAPALGGGGGFWDAFLKVGVFAPSRCHSGPVTVVLTNRQDCEMPPGGAMFARPKPKPGSMAFFA